MTDWTPVLAAALFGLLVVIVLRTVRRWMDELDTRRQIEAGRKVLEKNLGAAIDDLQRQVRDLAGEIQALRSDISKDIRERGQTQTTGKDRSVEPALVGANDLQGTTDRPFSQNEAVQAYRAWKAGATGKPQITGWDIRWMRGAGTTPGSELAPGKPLLQDSEGKGDFVRFSESGESAGFVFPNPKRTLDPDVHGQLFAVPGRSGGDDPSSGIPVRRRDDGRWEAE